jgi:hypothetical protein
MIRPPIRLIGPTQRQFAASYIMEVAPDGCVVSFREAARSLEQNALMHSMAADLSRQVLWCGQTLNLDQWKRFATAKLKKDKLVFDCNEHGEPDANAGLIVLGASTAAMSVGDVSALIEWFGWMGARHNVLWTHEQRGTDLARAASPALRAHAAPPLPEEGTNC